MQHCGMAAYAAGPQSCSLTTAASLPTAWLPSSLQLGEVKETIPSLWAETQRWLAANPQHVAPHNLLPAFVKEGRGGEQLYTGCHMWSNFEVRV